MNRKLIFLVIALVFVFAHVLEVPAAPIKQPKKTAPKEQPKMGGTLTVGLAKETGNPNPFIQTQSTTQYVRETSYESLLILDANEKIIPNLAEKYEVSAGGTQFTLRLRKGVKFHNGREMKADDVIWSANHVKDPKNGAYGQNIIKDVKAVDKIDDYTVKFTLSKPSTTFLYHLSYIRMLPIVPANSLRPGQIKLEPNTFVPGTGAFVLEQYQTGFGTVIRKFPEYWGPPAYVDKIFFRPIPDGANRFNALRTGDVMMADRLSPLDAARVMKGEIKGLKILEEPMGGYQHLIVNYDNPFLRKLEMRQALLYATDQQRLIDEAYFGAATKAEIMMDPKGIWAKAANLPPHKRDLAKAKALLKAAGYNGQELVLIGRKSAAQYLESYQRMFSEAGINVKIEILEDGVMRDRATQGKYDLFTTGADATPDPVTTMMTYYYTNPVEKGTYSSPKVDRLLDNLNAEFDQKKRLKIFQELAWTIHNDVADIPLFFETRYFGMSEKTQGYPPPGYDTSANGNFFKHAWIK